MNVERLVQMIALEMACVTAMEVVPVPATGLVQMIALVSPLDLIEPMTEIKS